jgi:hypothetical protein
MNWLSTSILVQYLYFSFSISFPNFKKFSKMKLKRLEIFLASFLLSMHVCANGDIRV